MIHDSSTLTVEVCFTIMVNMLSYFVIHDHVAQYIRRLSSQTMRLSGPSSTLGKCKLFKLLKLLIFTMIISVNSDFYFHFALLVSTGTDFSATSKVTVIILFHHCIITYRKEIHKCCTIF